ncbi:MAG: 4Fe-4S double cluster binding domain-containing protein [Candidatus Bathyarchaeia archaeon]
MSSGANLVGIVSTSSLDSLPKIWVDFWEYQKYTVKSTDYLEDACSAIILGYHVWDDMFELVLRRGDELEYPVEWRGRLFARRVLRHLERLGYTCVFEPELSSKKKMAQLGGLGNYGKNTLIINPKYGPWIRLRSIITNAELIPDEPFVKDLCGECDLCLKACPVEALSPYRIDPNKCLLGIHPSKRNQAHLKPLYERYAPTMSKNSYLMCMECQKVCPYGRLERGLK